MRSFVDVVRENAQHEDRAVTFMRTSAEERKVSFPELWREAKRRGRAMLDLGLKKGDRVALVLPEPDEFVLSFIGALTAGIVAVPMYPPQTMAKMEAYGDTVRHVLASCGATVVVTSETLKPMIEEHVAGRDGAGANARVVLEADVRGDGVTDVEAPPAPGLDDLAFLQFTSGSTSKPKGVMVTHGNLSANAHAIMVDGLKSTGADRGVSWLPLYHDMGLIGFVVAPLYTLVQVMFLPTSAFIRRPSMWLDAIHRFRGTITFAPNFAFSLATRAVTESQAKDWDLSCLRVLGCGAEPIQADVMRGFTERFAKHGLKAESALPCYGMAEATLAITFADLEALPRTEVIDVEAMRRGRAEIAEPTSKTGGTMELVGCGKAFPGHEIKIAAPSGDKLADRSVGEVWLRGPSVTAGYFGNPEATEETFGGGWLRTGDLGYVAHGELFICGRAKDLIILNGKNYYPQDIERVVAKCPAIRDGQCVAFSRLDESGGEHAVIVAEAKLGPRAGTVATVMAELIQLVRAEIGIVLGEVHLIRRGTLPKTSSGKVRRREAKKRLEEGDLELLTGDASDEPQSSVAPGSMPPSEATPSARFTVPRAPATYTPPASAVSGS
jgi:fatty-acyl-CoA synthase